MKAGVSETVELTPLSTKSERFGHASGFTLMPCVVLVAGGFRPEVTTTVLWLIDNFEMDIRCVRLRPFVVGERTLVHSEVIIPLPEAEQYRLGVQRKRRHVIMSKFKKHAPDACCRI